MSNSSGALVPTLIPLVDLKAQYEQVKQEVRAAIEGVLDQMHLFLGPQAQSFEEEFAAYTGSEYGVGLSSGTEALVLALRSYTDQLQGAVAAVPVQRSWAPHVFYVYVVQVQKRDQFRRALEQEGVATGVHYPLPIHLQPACSAYGYRRGMLPVTEAAAERIVSPPMYPELSEGQLEAVVAAVNRAVRVQV